MRVQVHPQSLLAVTASLCVTVKLPQSLNSALISPSFSSPVVSALAKQLSCSVMLFGHVPLNAGAVWSEPLTLIVGSVVPLT